MTTIIQLVLAIGYPLIILWQLRSGRLRDRADPVLLIGVGIFFLLVARHTVDWTAVPPVLWLVGLLILAVDTVYAGRVATELPAITRVHSTRRVVSVGLQLLVVAVLIGLLL
ncbi:hypothetical protein ACIA49_39315 [Kribbella sp. NPDC051587]|uniref:hypothetical protein n=1 Tax=Kribbella sp. NPDC051587 TaxID=3364119 RepID=UPI0037ACDDC1